MVKSTGKQEAHQREGRFSRSCVCVNIVSYHKGMSTSQPLERRSHRKNKFYICKSNTTVIYKVSILKLIECLYNMGQQGENENSNTISPEAISTACKHSNKLRDTRPP